MQRVTLIFLTLVVVAAIATILMLRNEDTKVITLANGARIELLGTAVGGATFTTEKHWHRFLRKILPPRMTRWLPAASSGACSSGTNSITVYFRTSSGASAIGGSTPWDGYRTLDGSGFVYQRDGGYCSFGSAGPGIIYGLTLRAYPRRQKNFRFEFLDQNGVVLGTFQVPNPVHGPFAAWQPQVLPQTKTNGPVALTLQSLHESGNDSWHSIKAKWDLLASNPSWEKATVRHTTFQDASGNDGQWLARVEPAWKMCAQVFRERPQDFAESERMTVTNLSVPVTGEFVGVDQSAVCSGVNLTIHMIGGAGTLYITNGVSRGMSTNLFAGHGITSDGKTTIETWGSLLPFVLVEAKNAQSDDDIWLRLRDKHGNEIKFHESGGYDGTSKGGRIYKRTFNVPETKTVSLEVIVNRPLSFEFLVNPADVQAAKPNLAK